jgi:predicted pyridoxine 5'-phosphate oxidase superfamily flavin-nucleotide-binding protein
LLEITGQGALATQMFTTLDKEIPPDPPDVAKIVEVLGRNGVTVAARPGGKHGCRRSVRQRDRASRDRRRAPSRRAAEDRRLARRGVDRVRAPVPVSRALVVEDPKTLLIPDRKGNRLVFSLQNILANPRIAALLAIRLSVEKCFFHCAKAFERSGLWKPESWPARQRISFGERIAPRLGGGEDVARQIDELVEADYRDNL